MTKNGRRGQVEYGRRAFHQDAVEAMRGDIVRGLIELITNADDAYENESGGILIEVEHCHGPWRVVVRDRAKGMRAAFMEKAFAKLGERTSGFESGADVRGNLGRGAKDLAAFGRVQFESICEGYYSKLVLEPSGQYELARERKATQAVRDELHIKGTGTVVTLHVSDNIRCPRHERLREQLSRHYQLRDILSDPNRTVKIRDLGKGTTDTLRYIYPDLPQVLQASIKIEGYPSASALVTIQRGHERFEDSPSDPLRPGGLLVKGRRAIYESTLFGFESNPHAGWFFGVVKCPFVDQLAAEYDRRLEAHESQDTSNPIPIISRRRDGLQHSHPFYRALAAAVEKPLGELVEAEERAAKAYATSESFRLRRTLDALGKDLGKLIDEDLKEIEAEALPDTGGGVSSVPPLKLIPEQCALYMGEEKTITLLVRKDLGADDAEAELDPEGVVEFVDGSKVPLGPHKRRSDVLVGQVRVRPLLEGKETLLTARCRGESAVALLEVRPERIIEPVEVEPPETLEFERDTYRVGWMKKRTLRLLAPMEIVASEGASVHVTSTDSGVVVLRGGVLKLKLDEAGEFYVGAIEVEPRTLGARAQIGATLGPLVAKCSVIVTQEEEGPRLLIRVVDEEAGHRRALVETDRESRQIVMKVMGRHPAIRRYRGAAPDFPGDELSACKALIAEIVAGEAVRMIMEKKFQVGGDLGLLDAANLYVEHSRYMTRYLPRCHRALVGDPELRLNEPSRPAGTPGPGAKPEIPEPTSSTSGDVRRRNATRRVTAPASSRTGRPKRAQP